MRVSGARPGLYQVPHETDLVAHESFRSQVIIYVTCDIYMTPTQLKLEREREARNFLGYQVQGVECLDQAWWLPTWLVCIR